MNVWVSVLLVAHLLVAAGICGFVLLQHGKGADMGAAFGSGSAGSVFGAAGSANFLSRTTAWLAAVFFLTSVGLTYVGTQHARSLGGGLMDRVQQGAPAPKGAPDVPAKGAAPAGDAAKVPAGDATKAPAGNGVPAGAGGAPPPSKADEVPK
jgi:preprotein translocase subunit SecG